MEELPIEIIETIVCYVSPQDVLRLRQTCTKLYNKTNAHCSRSLFNTLATDLSLHELCYLSEHFINNTQLARGIHAFRIQLKYDDTARGLGYDYYWNRRKRGQHLILPCDGFEALHKLFGHYLLNCRTIQIHARDRQSEIDGPDDQLEPADVLQLVLLLAQHVSTFQIDALEIFDPPRAEGLKHKGTHLSAERLPLETLRDPDVLAMLGRLRSLTMTLVYPDELVASGWLESFFGALRSARRLALDLDMSYGELADADALMRSINSPSLEDVELSRFKTTTTILKAMLGPCAASLSVLRLKSLTTVLSLFGSANPNDAGAGDKSWKHWLQVVAPTYRCLTCLELDVLSSELPDGSRTHLHFADLAGFSVPEDEDTDDEFVIRVGSRWCKYKVPLEAEYDDTKGNGDSSSVEPLVLDVALHGWAPGDQLVLPGIRYEGRDMMRALAFISSHSEEMRIF